MALCAAATLETVVMELPDRKCTDREKKAPISSSYCKRINEAIVDEIIQMALQLDVVHCLVNVQHSWNTTFRTLALSPSYFKKGEDACFGWMCCIELILISGHASSHT
jgi:hypothetical protein